MHGSEGTWRKFLNASVMLKVSVAICGGDLTGKMIVPVVEGKNKKYTYYLMGKTHTTDEAGLEKAFKDVRGIGYYPHLKNEREHKDVINGEGKVVEIDESHEMISCGWVNPSPWKTAREEEEDKLEQRLEQYISQLKNVKSAIFNFHAPPYQTKLDDAPLPDKNLNPIIQGGSVVMVPVGSKAVKKVIEKHQPFLGLHGHIHEAAGSMKIGKTYCVNPGSEYAEGIVRAFLIEFKGDKLVRLQRIEG